MTKTTTNQDSYNTPSKEKAARSNPMNKYTELRDQAPGLEESAVKAKKYDKDITLQTLYGVDLSDKSDVNLVLIELIRIDKK